MACAAAVHAAPPAPFIAGTAPYERPAAAPAVKDVAHGEAWWAAALTGIAKPVPESVQRLLDDQGAWYTPFARRGMTGLYDLRGLHAPPTAAR
jgi:hypothetical protein